jgi:hypothetical protein
MISVEAIVVRCKTFEDVEARRYLIQHTSADPGRDSWLREELNGSPQRMATLSANLRLTNT